MKRIVLIMLLFLIFSGNSSAKKITTFDSYLMPDVFYIDEGQLYIVEGSSVFIHSMKDFSLIAKFGRKGEGPGEFKSKPQLNITGDQIFIYSESRASFYSKKGEYISEVNNIVSGRRFQPIGDKFLGYFSDKDKDGIRFSGIYLYNSKFEREKNVYKYRSLIQSEIGRGWHLFARSYIEPIVCGNKIIVAGDTEFVINIFDSSGKESLVINKEYKRVKFTSEHGENVLGFYKTNPNTAPEYEWWRKNIHFPQYFPAIRKIYPADKKIYVRTYKNEKSGSEFFVFDMNGKRLKHLFLKISPNKAKNSYPYLRDSTPFVIKNGMLYQLILDENTEKWSLFAENI